MPRPLSWLISLALIVTIGQRTVLPDGPTPCTGTHAPGIVLVGFHDQSWREFDSDSQAKGALDPGDPAPYQSHTQPSPEWLKAENIVATIPEIDVMALRVPNSQEYARLRALRHDPRVAFAELDYVVCATDTPNDPGWAEQWGSARVGAPAAWHITTATPDVVVAVLDSGIQLEHEDLVDGLWANPDEVPGNGVDDDGNGQVDDFQGWSFYHVWNGHIFVPMEDNQVADEHGHGTHVAGIAGATFNNNVGIAGLAGGSRLMTVKVLDSQGEGRYSDVARGIIYAVDNGAQVINLSFGGTSPSQTLQEAVNYAHAHGVLVVAASGNDGGPILYPAACEHVLGVAAVDQNDTRPSFSNYGPKVDAAAPGVSIYSTGWPGDSRTDCTSGYCRKSGTSAATPHVAGLAALIWSARPDLTESQVTSIITNTATDVNADTAPAWDEYLGWGRIEAGQALSATVHTGRLYLNSSSSHLIVGETATITATVPFTDGTANLFAFAASGGAISPALTALSTDTVTAVLTAGPVAGMAIITGTTRALKGSLFLRLLPGPMVSITLRPASWKVMAEHSTVVTLTATDRFGNPPLDGTPINWTATGGTVTPTRSPFDQGIGRTLFTAGSASSVGVITASLDAESLVSITIGTLIPHQYHYLPIVLRGEERRGA
jgi:subtilisin family serine protease